MDHEKIFQQDVLNGNWINHPCVQQFFENGSLHNVLGNSHHGNLPPFFDDPGIAIVVMSIRLESNNVTIRNSFIVDLDVSRIIGWN
jgi:hypothetical protein